MDERALIDALAAAAWEAGEAILAVLTRHPQLRALFDQGWLALFAMDDAGAVAWRYCPGAGWVAIPPAAATERRAA